MQQAVYLIVALAVAAAVLSLAVAMKAVLPPPEAPLEHAEALVYVKVKPLNGSYWLGVHAPYGDVVVRQVRVGNATYVLGATAPVGRDAWLNASGRPITAQCGDSVEVVTAKGGAARSLAFTVQCPRAPSGRVNVTAEVDWGPLLKGLAQYLEWINTLDSPKIAVTIDPYANAYVVKNVYKIPLLIVIGQRDLVPYRAYDLAAAASGDSSWGKVIYLEPGAEARIPLVGPINTHGEVTSPPRYQPPFLAMSPLAIFVKNATSDGLEVFVNGVLYRVKNGTTVLNATYSEVACSGYPTVCNVVDVPIPMLTFYQLGNRWYASVLTTNGEVDTDLARFKPVWKLFPLDRALYVVANYAAYVPLGIGDYSYSNTLYLYVYPMWPVEVYNGTLNVYVNGTPVGAGGLSPMRQIGAVFRSYGNGTYVVWVGNATHPANATYYVLRPGDSLYVTYIDRQYWGDLKKLFDYASDMGYYNSLCYYVKREDYWKGVRYCDKAISAKYAAVSQAAELLPAVLKPLGWSDERIRSLVTYGRYAVYIGGRFDVPYDLFTHVLPDVGLYYMNFSGIPIATIRYGAPPYCNNKLTISALPIYFPDGASYAALVTQAFGRTWQTNGACIWNSRDQALQSPAVAYVDGHNIAFVAYITGKQYGSWYWWYNVTMEVYLDGGYVGYLNYTCKDLSTPYMQVVGGSYCWLVGGTIPQNGWAPFGLRFVNDGGRLRVYKTPTVGALPTIKPILEGNTIPYFYLSTTRGAQIYKVELRTVVKTQALGSPGWGYAYKVFGNATVFTYLLANGREHPISFGQILVPTQIYYPPSGEEKGGTTLAGNEKPQKSTVYSIQKTPIDTTFKINGNIVTSVTVYQVTIYYSDGRTATYTETVTNYSGYSGSQSLIGKAPSGGSGGQHLT